MSYQQGLHIIASLRVKDIHLINQAAPFQAFIGNLISETGLTNLGEIYHDFGPGFTGVVCLSESHLSVHTWPEHQLINLDIYLSNHLRNNDGTVIRLFDAMVAYFQADIISTQSITR